MTTVEDGAALERLGSRYRKGDLRELSSELGRHREGCSPARVFAALEEFNPYSVELGEVPLVSEGAPTEMYMHDFVAPQPGMQGVYEVQIREAFMKMLEIDTLPMKTWGGFETVAGGGRVPQSLMVTWIANAPAISNLISQGNPRVAPEPGSWMSRGPQAPRHVGLAPRPQRPVVADELTHVAISARGTCTREFPGPA